MTSYGFRLFLVQGRFGHGQSGVDFSEHAEGRDAFEDLVRSIRRDKGDLQVGAVKYATADSVESLSIDEPDDPTEDNTLSGSKRQPHLRVEDVVVTGRRIDVRVRYGREGDFDWATGGARDFSLKGRASTREYRVILYVPKVGDQLVMIAETRARTHAAEHLARLLSVRNSLECPPRTAEDKRKKILPPWIKWLPTPITDTSRIAEIAREGMGIEIELKRKGLKTVGGRGSGMLAIRQNGLPKGKGMRAKMEAIILGWASKSAVERVKINPAKKLADLIEGDVSHLQLNDGEISFLENGKNQTISPTKLDKLFVYPLGDIRPSDAELRRDAVLRLRPLAVIAKVNVDFGDDVKE